MHNDMAKLIVKGHSRPKDHSHSTKTKERDWDPEPAKMKDPSYGWNDGPRDHLNPLFNFLKSNVGRPWAKVYSEICAVADARQARCWDGGWRDFYYDSKGILHRWGSENVRRKSYWKSQQNPDEYAVNGNPYVRINGCWFGARDEYITECREEFDFLLRKKVKRYFPRRETRKVRQLGKKELQRLGLSNQPDWKWYEHTQ
jgi:hypothetical protein